MFKIFHFLIVAKVEADIPFPLPLSFSFYQLPIPFSEIWHRYHFSWSFYPAFLLAQYCKAPIGTAANKNTIPAINPAEPANPSVSNMEGK
jgi:hypothetical protein